MSLDDIEKLKRNNQELQEIINNSWDGIGIIDKNTKLMYINNAFMPILGYSKEEILQKNFISLMEEEYAKEFLELLVIDSNDKKYQAEIDIVCKRKDNKKVYLKITISTMLNKNLFVINTKDITSQISDDEILNDYVISMHCDVHGHITKTSSAFLNLCGYEKDEIIGKHYSFFAHEDTDFVIYTNIDKSLDGLQEWSGKLKNIRKDGKPFWINMKIKPTFNKYGDVTGYTSLMFDITNEINLNDEATMLQEQISTAKNEIKQKNTLLIHQTKLSIISETLQKLSHEWRQPLNLISIQAQKLELEYELDNNPSIDTTIKTLEKIKDEADKLSSTIENFQNFIEPKDEKVYVKPSQIINKTIEMFSDEDDSNDIEIKAVINDDLEFETYESELITVIGNILINAKEALVRNKVNNALVEIKEYILNNRLYIEIRDNAGGVPDDIIHKIFEPYFSTKEKKHGVGLGLYTSKTIVTIHLNGLISVNNTDNGTVFKISIPTNE